MQGLLQGPTLRQCAMLFWIKTEDLQGLKRLGVAAVKQWAGMDRVKPPGSHEVADVVKHHIGQSVLALANKVGSVLSLHLSAP